MVDKNTCVPVVDSGAGVDIERGGVIALASVVGFVHDSSLGKLKSSVVAATSAAAAVVVAVVVVVVAVVVVIEVVLVVEVQVV
ncbi:hypothetical protein ElyMa_001928600 [Elysia marginata]|uniref:Peptidase S8/S53 domain-containing protein n=1 Tax=Elysia marginata TaxID=1093978 RepID=A0AAV4EW39_9GAST|nr:hypothetical protein ElyMa_001928600 [Elysia marginata]